MVQQLRRSLRLIRTGSAEVIRLSTVSWRVVSHGDYLLCAEHIHGWYQNPLHRTDIYMMKYQHRVLIIRCSS